MITEIELDRISLMHNGLSLDEKKVQMKALQGILRLAEEKAEFLELGFVLINITSAIEKLQQSLGDDA
jgi:hypothetical protein